MERLGGEERGQISAIRQVALAPIIATWLFAQTQTSTSIAVYIAALAVLSFICAFVATETYQVDIEAERAEERQLIAERGGTTAS